MNDNILHFVFNPKSGRGRGVDLKTLAQKHCHEAGWKFAPYEIIDPSEIDSIFKMAVENIKRDGGTLAAAGGDGTLRAAVQALQGEDIRFAAIPCGTFNLFARSHDIPEDHDQAFKLAVTGSAQRVRIAQLNDHVFLINANIGLYAKAINERKARTQKFGRHRLVAVISTLISMIQGHRTLEVDIVTETHHRRLRTPMIFIGNNALQLKNLSLSVAKDISKDRVAVFTMRPVSTLVLLRILFRGLTKTLDRDDAVDSFSADSLTIYAKKKSYKVALDGEMFRLQAPFKVESLPREILLVKP